MFIVVLSAVLALMNVYLWKRLVKDTTGSGRTRRILTAVLIALAALLVATLVVPRFFDVPKSGWYAWPGYLWFGLLAYLFLTLLVLEPVRLALRRWITGQPQEASATAENERPVLNRRMFIARTSAVAAGAASVGLVGIGAATALGPPELLQVPVRLRRLDPALRGFRIAVVSDIHLGPLAGRAHAEQIVSTINAAEPDLVAIVGDLVDGTVEELGAAAAPLRDLSAPEGTFFVTGNHEYFVDDTAAWLTELERLGIRPLRNENTA
ncbi:MAG: metallophosphoesterase, partial [Mycobacterium sp.]